MTRLEKCKLAFEKGFTYNPTTGIVTTPTGVEVNRKTVNGYIHLSVYKDGKRYSFLAHQYAWYFIFKETVPCIDHINRVKTDNRISNLRSVTKSENAMNMKNVQGVYFCKRSKRWIAHIMVNYKRKHLGTFINKDDALNCYKVNKDKYHIINN